MGEVLEEWATLAEEHARYPLGEFPAHCVACEAIAERNAKNAAHPDEG